MTAMPVPVCPPPGTMRVWLLAALLAGCQPAPRQDAPLATSPAAEVAAPLPPDLAYPELFDAVQRAALFDDQKTFPDRIPRQDPARIRAEYLARRSWPGFDLRAFVDEHFQAAPRAATPALPDDATLAEHIDALWPLLSRDSRQVPRHGSQLALPRPYVVPGGRFGEMYYWDSYFTMIGLHASGQGARARDMLTNFAALIDTWGHIPNGTRSYYLSRSQPPYFSHMVELEAAADASLRLRYLPQLRREHAYWMAGAEGLARGQAARHVVRMADGSLLNRYWDARDTPRAEAYLHDRRTAAQARDRPATEVYRDLRAGAESGWDYSSRWLDDRASLRTIRTTAMVAVDLNSLLHHLETTIAVACEQAADAGCVRSFRAQAEARRRAIDRYLWHRQGFYADYDWQRGRTSDQVTAATLYPLFVGIASPAQAHAVARTVESRLLTPGGVATTRERTGQQWDAPNLWAPLQWVAIEGLRRNGEPALAQRIGERFLSRVQAVYGRERKLVEKYSSDTGDGGSGGEYPLQDGFGWSNGVARALLQRGLTPSRDDGTTPAAR